MSRLIRRRNLVILAGVLIAVVAVVSLTVRAASQSAEQQALMDRSFVTLGRFPDAVAVYKLQDERHIRENYVTPHAAAEIRSYYDQRLHEMGWHGPGPDVTVGDAAVRCYVDSTGRITAKLSTRTVSSASSWAYEIELSRDGCIGLRSKMRSWAGSAG